MTFDDGSKDKWIDEEKMNQYPQLVNQYLSQKNIEFKRNECHINKSLPCFNKNKTRGINCFI